MKILLVEDEAALARTIALNLKKEGHTVIHFDSAEKTLAGLEKERVFKLAILDIGLAGKINGIDLCRQMRQANCDFPVLFLTARDLLDDKEAAFQSGGDDYLTKPFALKELLLRIQARTRNIATIPDEVMIGTTRINLKAGSAQKADGSVVRFNEREMKILQLFMERRGQPLGRDQILDAVWGNEFPTNRTIDNYILKFRKIFEENPARPVFFITRHGTGYELTL